jgi:fructokinase
MYLVCGEALIDCFLDTENSNGSLRFDARVGGSPFNVALGISRLGGEAALLTGISTDMFGRRLVRVLEREKVETRYLFHTTRPTTLVMVGLDEKGQPAYVMYGENAADRCMTPADLPSFGSEVSGFHFGSYSLVVMPVADALASVAASAGNRFVSVDPNVRPTIEPDLELWRMRLTEYAALADLLKISSEDLAILYPGVEPETKAAEWLDAGVRAVVVTDGANEATAWTYSGHVARVKPPSVDIKDTVGAGDSFQAALLAQLAVYGDPKEVVSTLDGARLTALLNFASAAAASTCTCRGAEMPFRHNVALG